jgi:hypothetical protein
MRLKTFHLFLFTLWILQFSFNVYSQPFSPLDYKTFVSGPSLWISDPAGIILYRNDTRSVRNIVLCDTMENDSIFDIAESDNMLWVFSKSGFYQIDLNTTTFEKLSGNSKNSAGRLAVDDDFLWAIKSDTLWRFDKLGREWFPYRMNAGNVDVRGMYSNGNEVYCVFPSSIKIFSVKEEKWLDFPYKKGMDIFGKARFFLDKNALLLVDDRVIYRYVVDARSWDVIPASSPVVDMISQDSVIFFQTDSGIYQYFTKTSIVRPFDIPGIKNVRCFTRFADTLYCAMAGNYMKFDISAKTSDNIEPPPNISGFTVNKTLLMKDTLIAFCPGAIFAYDTKSRIWESAAVALTTKKGKIFSWDDDNGAKLSCGKGNHSQLRGSIRQDFLIDSATAAGTYYSVPQPEADLTLHSQFSKGNYLDVFFNNSDISQVPKKGAFYRGSPNELVESARLGTNTLNIPQSATILKPQYEGGDIILQSSSSLKSRDRKILKVRGGGGLITTETINEALSYSESGIYGIKSYKNDSRIKKTIVPGTLKVNIDGEDIDSADFMFVALTGSLIFNRQDLLDPTSIIKVSYQVKTVPDSGLSTVEFMPENNFGRFGYGSVTYSPVDWLSPQVSVVHLRTDGAQIHQLLNISSSSEIRSDDGELFLKINPEITWDAQTAKKAAALSIQSLVGKKLGLQYNGLMPDSGFVTTDNMDKGYGSLRHDADIKVTFDIKKELPISYYQHEISSRFGLERRYEIATGAHFQSLPFCDVTLSRNSVNAGRPDTLHISRTVIDTTDSTIAGFDTAIIKRTTTVFDSLSKDTLDRNKDKVKIRLYETSSPVVEALLHINRLNYDLSYTGFTSRKEGLDEAGNGNIFYGCGSVSPIKRLTFTIQGTYLKNAPGSEYSSEYNPSFILQTMDAPPGFDISMRSELDFKSYSDNDSGFSTLLRAANLTVKPGAWISGMNWIQPIAGYNQTIRCGFQDRSPGFSALLLPDTTVTHKISAPDIGANIFPTNDITIRNDNKFTTSDSIKTFYTFNDLKWRFGEKKFWQIRWEYDRDRSRDGIGSGRDYNRGFTQYINSWMPWLQTMTGVSSSITKSDTVSQIKAGPNLTVSINTKKFLFIRSFFTNNTLNVSWINNYSIWQSSPDILYSSYFRIIVFPDISFEANNSLTFNNGSFVRYSGRISASAIF